MPSGPAPGFRDAGNNKGYGTWYRVGGGGYSWSSTGSGAYARFLYFNYGFLARQASKTPCGRVASKKRAGRRQRDFAKKSQTFECRAAPSPARGGGGSRDP